MSKYLKICSASEQLALWWKAGIYRISNLIALSLHCFLYISFSSFRCIYFTLHVTFQTVSVFFSLSPWASLFLFFLSYGLFCLYLFWFLILFFIPTYPLILITLFALYLSFRCFIPILYQITGNETLTYLYLFSVYYLFHIYLLSLGIKIYLSFSKWEKNHLTC